MAEGTRRSASRRAASPRPNKGKLPKTDSNGASGRTIPLTPDPSIHNVLGGIYNSLPPMVRDLLPFGSEVGGNGNGNGNNEGGEDEVGGGSEPPKDKRGETSWQDVCFIHSIPGDDQDEGLVVLADGSMRRYIICKGINALLFDEADRELMARNFAHFANSCDSDIQVIIKARNLPVDEYLSRYQILIKTDNDYLKWYADYTDKWFRRVQDVHFVPQTRFLCCRQLPTT